MKEDRLNKLIIFFEEKERYSRADKKNYEKKMERLKKESALRIEKEWKSIIKNEDQKKQDYCGEKLINLLNEIESELSLLITKRGEKSNLEILKIGKMLSDISSYATYYMNSKYYKNNHISLPVSFVGIKTKLRNLEIKIIDLWKEREKRSKRQFGKECGNYLPHYVFLSKIHHNALVT
ncbi:hypothetical protein COB64_02445 [Candidatus Wolfebacteria bacterium]|nr:MAG: hypothetical protein COB64_02445 [Candidatus Wolfebacteria bacterium]